MYDRPSARELLEAACLHLEQQVVPAIKADRKLYFQTLVAINVLKIVGREMALKLGQVADLWEKLDALEGDVSPLPDDLSLYESELDKRLKNLCRAIQEGEYDGAEQRKALLDYLIYSTEAQLMVANPRFLQGLAAEANLPPSS